jgi:hypothetical protein
MRKRGEEIFGMTRRRRHWLVLPALLLSLGCGGPKGDISGKVIHRGKPLPAGTVTFFNSEGQVVGSSQISDKGDYVMTRVPPGPVKITVAAPYTIPNPAAPPAKGGKTKKDVKTVRQEESSVIRLDVPAKYSMPDQSGLTYTVQPGAQEHNLDLQ